jgi:hypothetical protein
VSDLVIHKYVLVVEDEQTLRLPKDARILSVQFQGSGPVLWALVDPEAERETRHFVTMGTGHPVGHREFVSKLEYLGTYQADQGMFVGHVFEMRAVAL